MWKILNGRRGLYLSWLGFFCVLLAVFKQAGVLEINWWLVFAPFLLGAVWWIAEVFLYFRVLVWFWEKGEKK